MSRKIIVAIDLGTSRSAYAYSTQGKAEDEVIIRVPEGSLRSVEAMKTETAVLLRSTHPHDVVAFGRSAYEHYIHETTDNGAASKIDLGGEGFLAKSGATSMMLRWFKMGLCERRGYQAVDDLVATAEGGQHLPPSCATSRRTPSFTYQQ